MNGESKNSLMKSTVIQRGYYMVATVSCDTAAIKEFDRLSLINNNVVRHMIVKLEA